MAYGDGQRVGGVGGVGDFVEFQEHPHHLADLVFGAATVVGDGLFDLRWCVARYGKAVLRRCDHGDGLGLADRECRSDVLAGKRLLDRHL